MKNATKLFAMILVISLLAVMMAGCSGKTVTEEPEVQATQAEETAAEPEKEVEEGPVSVTVGTTQAQGSFDNTTNSLNAGYMLVYDTVLARNADGEIVGNIASEWAFVDDLTLALTIRDDVYFSNGDLLTPEDVKFSLERFITTNSAYVSSTFYDCVLWDECTIEGNVLTLKFANPCPAILASLASPKWSCVLNKAYVESTGDDEFWDAPVGTGPYVCTEHVADSYMTFERRDDYWGETPQVELFTIKYYAEETTMFIDYENDTLDIILNVSDNNLQRVQSGEVAGWYDIVSQHDLVMLCLPEYVEAFNDIEVRKAIAYAIDYQALTDTAFGQLGKVSTSTTMSDTDFYLDLGTYEYDPEQARQILADAGYSDGDLSFRMVIVNFATNEKIAEALQAQLKDVGIDLIVESYDLGTAMSYFMNADLDIAIGEMNVPCVDPAQLYATAKPTHTNACMIQTDEQIVELLYAAEYEMDEAARQDYYEQIQQWFYDNYRWLPICEKMTANVYSERIASWDAYWTTVYADLKTVEVN